MGWTRITLSASTLAKLSPEALAAYEQMNAEADRQELGLRPNEEYQGEAKDRGLDHRGFNE